MTEHQSANNGHQATPPPAAQDDDGDGDGDGDLKAAALLIQKNYRGYRTRRELDGCSISADSRWTDAIHRLRLEQAQQHADSGRNDTASRWKRGGLLVTQLTGGGNRGTGIRDDGPVQGGASLDTEQDDNKAPEIKVGDVPGGNDGEKIDNIKPISKQSQWGLRAIERWTRGSEAQELSKIMEAQYWLEMVDTKHRYGSNLKYYHAAWLQDSDTRDNFFQWLDKGAGKHLSLDECSRERLEEERVIYLSAEQRKNYIVDVKHGKLVWRRNGKFVDTSRGKHRDLGQGRGIVELGEEEQKEEAARLEQIARQRGGSVSSLESEMESEEQAEAQHYAGRHEGVRRHFDILTPSAWADMLLRSTVNANTWIYVFNSRYELYVGLKKTGYFQHSSFLCGGRVLSAGLLKVDHGRLVSLSPLSGHYRAGTAHFRFFVRSMQQGGVDLDRVVLSKSLLMLAGLEKYGALRGKMKGSSGSREKQKQKQKAKTDKKTEHETNGTAKSSHLHLSSMIKSKLHLGNGSGNGSEKGSSTLDRLVERVIPSSGSKRKE